jgi:hypothetical protein
MQHEDSTTGTIEHPYAAEAEARWGNTEAYKQSRERVKNMTKADLERIKNEGDVLLKKFAELRTEDPASPEVQELVAQHFNGLRAFYEPSMEMYRGLGDLYVDDERFTKNMDKYGEGTAKFLRDAMHAYVDLQSAK